VESFIDKLTFKLHRAQIEKNRTGFWAAARMLDMAVGILILSAIFLILKRRLTRKLAHKSEAERGAEISALRQTIDDWKRQANQKRKVILASLKTLNKPDGKCMYLVRRHEAI
jgi:hypothetical protein